MKIGSRNKDKNVEHRQHRGGGRILQDPIGWESPTCTCMMPWCPIASRVKTRSIKEVHDLGKPCKANNICSLYICIYIYKEESEPTEPSSELCRIMNKSRHLLIHDVDHILSGSTELRPPPDHVAMMIAAKNGATTIATTVMATGRKARGPDNFIATGQMGMRAVQ